VGRTCLNPTAANPCSNNSEILVIEWRAAGICMSCPARAKLSSTHMVTEYRSWWLR
jgi:hypothetical protein